MNHALLFAIVLLHLVSSSLCESPPIKITLLWDPQGYPKYNGKALARVRSSLPSTISQFTVNFQDGYIEIQPPDTGKLVGKSVHFDLFSSRYEEVRYISDPVLIPNSCKFDELEKIYICMIEMMDIRYKIQSYLDESSDSIVNL